MNIGADGLKTGFTKEAGYGLVGSAVQNGLRLIVVVNGLKSEKERADEAQQAARMGLPQFPVQASCSPKARPSPTPRSMAASGYVPLVAQREVRLMVPRGVRERIIARVVYSGPVRAPVQKGQQIGDAEGLARRRHGARSAAAGRRGRGAGQHCRGARSTPRPSC